MKTKSLDLKLDQLLVDPNNYRLDYEVDGAVPIEDSKIENLQEDTLGKLASENLEELRQSILGNGFIDMDRIIVRKLEIDGPSKYVVVEGNRRTAALKSLINRFRRGKQKLEDAFIESTKSINVLCLYGTPDEIKSYSATIMGLRHVSGPKKWTGYQSARLIDELKSSGNSFQEIGVLLGIETSEAERRYYGYRAYEQMRSDKKYGNRIKRNHYTLMLEFLTRNKYCRDKWLKWDESKAVFKDKKNLATLYKRLTEGTSTKLYDIKNVTHARDFVKHLEIEEHRKLIDEGCELEELPELIDGEDKIEKTISRFLNFLDATDWSKRNQKQTSLFKRLQLRIESIL